MPRNIKWFEDEWTKCPFYIREAAGLIVCEAPKDYEGCRCALYVTFDNKRKHQDQFCRMQYSECPIHKDIMEKYR